MTAPRGDGGGPARSSRPHLVVFDCDGVLVDTERLATAIEARILTEMGYPHTQADVVEAFMGRADAEGLALLVALMGRELALEFDERSTAETRAAFARELQAVPGVAAILDALDAAGVPYCVASSGSHARMETTLGATGLLERLAGHIYSAEDVTRGKPWPDVFVHAAASEGRHPGECTVVEDSVNGVLAATAAGMRVLGFAGGLAGDSQLRAAGAETFATMGELAALLGLYSPRSA